MAPKKVTVTSKVAQTSASNPFNVRSTTDLSLAANSKTKSIAEIIRRRLLCLNKLLLLRQFGGVCRENHFPQVINYFNNELF
ncbi:hypothetical protein JCGZ_16662 [Jatropha curcas]|uniref:Uncharacterized protein n=1 Tax=Jatropha curcas TaxID=180498 RepID=A0A067K5W4_JATCU|nr:hypothetical protein JCGZ_16662 [Jatropha curcas]